MMVAVVGAGAWGKNIVKTLGAMGNLGAVVDARQELLDQFKATFPKIKTYTQVDQMLEDSSIKAVCIATPASSHFDVASSVIRAGKHVFVEKPMTLNVADAEALCEASKKAGVTLMVGHLLLYQNAIEFISNYLNSGKLGKVFSFHQERLNLGRARDAENALWSLGVHDLACLLYLNNNKSIRSVKYSGQRALQAGVEDDVYVHLGFDDKSEAHLHVSWMWPERRRMLTIVGEKGMLTFDELAQKVTLHRKTISAKLENQDQGTEVLFEGKNEPLKVELTHFLECCESGVEPRSSGRSALPVMRVLEQIEIQLQVERKESVR